MREHLRRAWRATRRIDPMLAEAREPLPTAVAYLWDWFRDLRASTPAGSGGLVPDPISCTELEAWQRLTGQHLTPWEFDTVRAMDRVAIAAYAAQLRTK